MELIAEVLNITTGGNRIAILSEQSASLLGVHSSDRIRLTYGTQEAIAIANIAAHFPMNRIGLYEEIATALGVNGEEKITVKLAPVPESLINVRAKLRGDRLREQDIKTIVQDVVERHLSSVEIAAFLTALKIYGLSLNEAAGGVAAESSVGTWTELTTVQPYVEKHAATVFSMQGNTIKIAYPIELFEDGNMPNILSSVAGNVFGLKALKNLRLIDIQFPKELLDSFYGPAYGIKGIRKLLKIEKLLG